MLGWRMGFGLGFLPSLVCQVLLLGGGSLLLAKCSMWQIAEDGEVGFTKVEIWFNKAALYTIGFFKKSFNY